MQTFTLAFIFGGMPGWLELTILGGVFLILFGKRVPEVARSVGQSVVEFKKGLQGIQEDIDQSDKPERQISDQQSSEAKH